LSKNNIKKDYFDSQFYRTKKEWAWVTLVSPGPTYMGFVDNWSMADIGSDNP
jgi:hypothetical protein